MNICSQWREVSSGHLEMSKSGSFGKMHKWLRMTPLDNFSHVYFKSSLTELSSINTSLHFWCSTFLSSFLGVFPANVMVTLSHVIQWQVFAIVKTTQLVTTASYAKKVSMEIQLKVPKMTANHVPANLAPAAFWLARMLFVQIALRGTQGISVNTVKMVTMATHQAFWVGQLLVRGVTAVAI